MARSSEYRNEVDGRLFTPCYNQSTIEERPKNVVDDAEPRLVISYGGGFVKNRLSYRKHDVMRLQINVHALSNIINTRNYTRIDSRMTTSST